MFANVTRASDDVFVARCSDRYDSSVSLHYELVVAIYLRQDLSESALTEVRWHCGLGPRPSHPAIDEPLFGADAADYLPGGEITRLAEASPAEDRTLGVFIRRDMLDDGLYELLAPLCRWLGVVAGDGYAGFWREVDGIALNVMVVRDGHTYMSTDDGGWAAATEGAPPWA